MPCRCCLSQGLLDGLLTHEQFDQVVEKVLANPDVSLTRQQVDDDAIVQLRDEEEKVGGNDKITEEEGEGSVGSKTVAQQKQSSGDHALDAKDAPLNDSHDKTSADQE